MILYAFYAVNVNIMNTTSVCLCGFLTNLPKYRLPFTAVSLFIHYNYLPSYKVVKQQLKSNIMYSYGVRKSFL